MELAFPRKPSPATLSAHHSCIGGTIQPLRNDALYGIMNKPRDGIAISLAIPLEHP
jgi:hypothetical protein